MSLKPFVEITAEMLAGLPDRPPSSALSKGARQPRAQDRAAQWRADMGRSYGYLLSQARSAEEQRAIDAEYQRLLAEGPDFARVRRKSEYRDAPQITLDREARLRLRVSFRAVMRNSWKAKDKGKHRGVISRTAESVFEVLMYLAEKHGRVFPSLDGIAFMAKCCKQSVVTALADLERLGFITRHRRRKRVQGPFGVESKQDSNAYDIHEPVNAWGRLATKLFGSPPESNNQAARNSNLKTYNDKVKKFGSHNDSGSPWDDLKREWEAA